jgi:hypothetical protein
MNQDSKKPKVEDLFYRASAADLKKIPGTPIAYWASPRIIQLYSSNKLIGSRAKKGLTTGDNDRFLRLWWEVMSRSLTILGGEKWFPTQKGGEFRRWYGNFDNVLNWEDNGYDIKNFKFKDGRLRSVIRNESFFGESGITWADISSGKLSMRFVPEGFIFNASGPTIFSDDNFGVLGLMNSRIVAKVAEFISPTLHFEVGQIQNYPLLNSPPGIICNSNTLICISQIDWDSFETSWDFTKLPLLTFDHLQPTLKSTYDNLRAHWRDTTLEMQRLEEENNRIFIEAYGLEDELTPDVPLEEITLTCNPYYRYGKKVPPATDNEQTDGDQWPVDQDLEDRLQSDTIRELISYAIGCMMGRYSLDKPGLILASQGETMADYVRKVEGDQLTFPPDEDAILPLTDQEWFSDDVTNRLREFVFVVWGQEHLQENLDFIAESLCLYAIKPKRGETSLETIRRYLSTQFYKDHMRTYKKRPIYWLFSSGKQKAFECLVYLHRYNEGTLSRMRTEYVTPLMGKYEGYLGQLNQQQQDASSTTERNRLGKEITALEKKQIELRSFDEKLRHYADKRISLDLDDGVKVNYAKFDDLLAESKNITGKKA